MGRRRDLAHRGCLARAVYAHEEHARRRIEEEIMLGLHEHLGQAVSERTAQLLGSLEVLARRKIAQVVGYLHGNLGTHVAHDEGVLKLFPEAFIDLAAEVEELIQSLAAALKSAREGIKQTHYAFTTFPVARSSF